MNGLTINAGGTTVSGLVINRFTGDGIVLATKGGDTVTACWIGTDSTGKLDKGNTGVGLRISGASNNMIGGHNDTNAPLIGAGNVISGNDSGGVVIARGPKFPRASRRRPTCCWAISSAPTPPAKPGSATSATAS